MLNFEKPKMFEWMRVNHTFATRSHKFKRGELYPSNDLMKQKFIEYLNSQFAKTKDNRYLKLVTFIPSDELFQRAHKDGNFKELIVVRYGGIGDLIALTSILDYFDDKNIHFITQEHYFPIFDWFVKKPKLYRNDRPIKEPQYKGNYACYHSLNLVENGHSENWFHLFFKFIGEDNPGEEFYRPALKLQRINNNISNVERLSNGKPSLLIVNRSTAMMRSIKLNDVIKSLPNKNKYNIFAYKIGVTEEAKNVNIIESDNQTFYLDLYDADMVISVDTGALHFREGIEKPAIGLYNSFTTDSRTKYYQYTKSFDIKSTCKHQPCFFHERPKVKHCIMGKEKDFAAPCFDSGKNDKLIEQLKTIFKKEL